MVIIAIYDNSAVMHDCSMHAVVEKRYVLRGVYDRSSLVTTKSSE
jgi:hypothetical protein